MENRYIVESASEFGLWQLVDTLNDAILRRHADAKQLRKAADVLNQIQGTGHRLWRQKPQKGVEK